jgi:hypothetical protein
MKHLIGVIGITMLLLNALHAQVGFGLRTGFTSTGVRGTVISAYNNTVIVKGGNTSGLAIGFPVEIPLSDVFSIQPELNFVQKGYSVEAFNLGGFGSEFDYTYNYLEVPVLAKLNLGSGNFKFQVMAGPYAALGMGDIKELIDGEEGKSYTYTSYGAKKFDFGAQGGLGCSFDVGSMRLFADARYMFGLGQVSDNSAEDYKHGGLNLGVGVFYRFE